MNIQNMYIMKSNLASSPFVWTLFIFISCTGRNNIESQVSNAAINSTKNSAAVYKMASGNCEDCELMFTGIPENILPTDTSDGWFEEGQKLLVSGRILKLDQSTPAADVILYYYHTDQKGLYTPDKNTDRGAQRHGRLRGWIKTGPDGTYSIYTSRPAQYPGNKFEAHIHVIIKEPDIDLPYWIDEWVFDDDPLLTSQLRARLPKRGGSGILKTREEGDVQVVNHDVILGLNIPGYPARR